MEGEKYYFKIKPKETPNVQGFVFVSSGKKLESIMENDYLIEPISESEALNYKEEAENWKIKQAYCRTYVPPIPKGSRLSVR